MSLAEAIGRVFGKLESNPSAPKSVAEVFWEAANETSARLPFRAGADAVELLDRRKAQDDATFIGGIKELMKE